MRFDRSSEAEASAGEMAVAGVAMRGNPFCYPHGRPSFEPIAPRTKPRHGVRELQDLGGLAVSTWFALRRNQRRTVPALWPSRACAAPLLQQRLTYALPALRCASHRCLPLTPSIAPRQVYRTTSSNLMLRHILTVITLGTAHGFGPLPSVEATDMNTCWKPLQVRQPYQLTLFLR